MLVLIPYARASANGGDADSIAAQLDAIREWADRHGHLLRTPETDDGVSGSKDETEREGLASALGRLGRGEVDGIVVHRLDRLARALHVQEAVLGIIWRAGGRVFEAVHGEVLRDDPEDPMRRFVRLVMGAASELERGMVVARTMRGRRRWRERGYHVGGRRAYGTTQVEREDEEGRRVRKALVPNERELEGIRRIGELRAEGLTWRAVADALTREGFEPPSGGRWYHTSARRIFERSQRD